MMPDSEYPTEIILKDNNLGHKDIIKLFKTFRAKLTTLNFKGNTIGKIGITYFAEKLGNIPSTMKLTYLNLEGCKLTDKGGSILINDGLPYLPLLT